MDKTVKTILVVDDSVNTLEVLQRNLSSKGYQVLTAANVSGAIRTLEISSVDLVITDLKMPGSSGINLVKHVRQNHKETEVMMITGYPSVGGAIEAVKSGAEEYLAKPFTDEELYAAVDRAFEKLRERRTSSLLSMSPKTGGFGLIGDSSVMARVHTESRKAAKTAATVLITGESGTGKELVARAIHYGSSRASAPFVPVNCGAIPDNLLESELFGHVKGSFTGASETRAGFFQTADGGSIFLDEISDTSLNMQVKLLRVLQNKEICMVGSSKPHIVDVRILAATNKDLFALVRKGEFREDLYYRLNVITINIPPLHDRGDDILQLINHFSAKFAKETGRPAPRYSDKALAALLRYHWPGNIRELENVLHRLILMNEGGVIEVPDLPPMMRFSAPQDPGPGRTLADIEGEYIKGVLVAVHNNKSKAAEILGIDRKTLRNKLRQIESQDEKS